MKNQIEQILNQCGYRENPYFVALKNKTFDKDDFVETQIQFYNAVVFFSRPMAALAAKIPTPELRVEVIRNVWEEHGEGDFSKVHGSTFVEFLSRIGNVDQLRLQETGLLPDVRIFNTCLSGACVLDEYLIGVGALGMIERMFCEISSWIGKGIVENGWLAEDRLIHYDLHAELDIKHSDDFFNILLPSWEDESQSRYYIEQGLMMGATMFYNLYSGLYRERKMRYKIEAIKAHTRAGTKM
jgi:pyrroloquinoline-quinone synthase